MLLDTPWFSSFTDGRTGLFADGTAAAPSVSFLSAPSLGFYKVSSSVVGYTGGNFSLPNGFYIWSSSNNNSTQSIQLDDSTGIMRFRSTTAGITWAASGVGVADLKLATNGRFMVGTGGTDSGALLQIGTDTTTTAGGMVFGTTTFLSRGGAGILNLTALGTTSQLSFINSGIAASGAKITLGSTTLTINNTEAGSFVLGTNNATALTLDASLRTILAGALRLSMAYTAGVGAATGYLTVQDSGGTTYKIPVLV